MPLKWHHKVPIWLKVIYLITRYGLEGAGNKVDAELKEQMQLLSSNYYKTLSEIRKGGKEEF